MRNEQIGLLHYSRLGLAHRLDQTRTSADVCDTTASSPDADMAASPRDVAEVPIGNIGLFWKARFSQTVLDGGQVLRSAEGSPILDTGNAHEAHICGQ